MALCLLGTAAAAAMPVADPSGAAAEAPVPPAAGQRFRWPLGPPHHVVRPFRPPAHRYGSGHRGVDIAAAPKAAVHAAAAGVVVYAGPLAGRGVISIQHANGIRTTYEPVAAAVQRDDHVRAGQLIGTLRTGHAGCRAACLHWGALRVQAGHRSYLDPLALLGAAHVRLLPWPR